MRPSDWLLLLGLVAVEATVIYVGILALAKWLDVRRARHLALERREGLR